MSGEGEQTQSRRNRLDRERILDTAMRIVDREGLAALSMRRLGSELGVDPMAIYYHLPNKGAIISGLVQRVFQEIAEASEPSDGATWKDRVRRWGLTYHRIAREHANLTIYLISNAGAATDSVMQANDALYDALAASGLSSGDVVRSADTIVDYIHGVILGDAAPETNEAGWRTAFRDHIESAPPEHLPALRRVFGELGSEDMGLDVEFGLDTIIDGLERRLPTP